MALRKGLLDGLVCVSAFATAWRMACAEEVLHKSTLAFALMMQAITLVGLRASCDDLIQLGHVGFVVTLWVGAILFPERDQWLVRALSLVALLTRWGLGVCLFDDATGSDSTSSRWWDALFVGPVVLGYL